MFAGRIHAAPTDRDSQQTPHAGSTPHSRGRVMFILHGRAGVHARRTRLPYNNVFWFVYAMPGVCRGGIYASRQGCALRGVCGKIACFRCSVGRAFTPAANIAFFKIIGAAGSAPAGASRTGAAAPFRSATAEGGSWRGDAQPPKAALSAERKRGCAAQKIDGLAFFWGVQGRHTCRPAGVRGHMGFAEKPTVPAGL